MDRDLLGLDKFELENDLVADIQTALREAANLFLAPENFYQPSPGQLLDHVHHRVAVIAAKTAIQLLMISTLKDL